jgi:hypothetical protein
MNNFPKIEGGYVKCIWEEVATATKVKWLVKDGVVVVVAIILKWQV